MTEEEKIKIALERYDDLCDFFKDEETINKILNDRTEFKAWLNRILWHIVTLDKIFLKINNVKDNLFELFYLTTNRQGGDSKDG